jgi:TolB-like protein
VANKKEIIGRFVKEEKLKNVKESVKVYEIDLQNSPSPKMPSITQSNSYRAPATFKGNRSTNRKTVFIFIGAVIIILSGYLLYHLFYKTDKGITSSSNVEVIDKSIAVLPFVNMSNDKNQEYFSDGLSEEFLNLLAKIPELKVIGRTSSFSFKGKNEDLRSIAQKLGVAHILEGSVRKEGNKIRVSAQLIKATDGSQLWGDIYDRDLKDIFKLQDEIAREVVKQLKVKLLDVAASASSSLINTEAYNLMLQGNYFAEKRDKVNSAKAIDLYLQALAIDSLDHRVWAALAQGLSIQASWGWIDPHEGYQKVREAATKSISLEQNQAEAYRILGDMKMYYDWDWEEAENKFNKALNSEPRNPDLLRSMGSLTRILGRLDESFRWLKKSIDLDPLKNITYFHLGFQQIYANHLEDAIVTYKKILELNPQFPMAHVYLGEVYLLQGKPEIALVEIQQEQMKGKDFGLTLAFTALGQQKAAKTALSRYISEFQGIDMYLIAETYSFLGEKDKAFEWLEKAYSGKDVRLPWFKGDPLLKNLEDDPRHKAFLKKMNLPLD